MLVRSSAEVQDSDSDCYDPSQPKVVTIRSCGPSASDMQAKRRRTELDKLAMENPGVHWLPAPAPQLPYTQNGLDQSGQPSPADSEIDLLDLSPDFVVPEAQVIHTVQILGLA